MSSASGKAYSRITGTGSYLPPGKVTNQQLADRLALDGVQTSDEWIRTRTGIRERYFAQPDVPSSELAAAASRQALEAAGRKASELDLIIVATSTPDMVFPSTASILQHKLGANGCAAFDVQAVCTGFIFALSVADAMIRAGAARTALVVGAEVFSRLLDFKDRSTCVLFGDGAGAVVLEADDRPGILACDIHTDGQYQDILCVPGNVCNGSVIGEPLLRMDGQAVFKLAVGLLDKAARAALGKAGLAAEEIDWLVPHQANIRIMQSTARKLQMPQERVIVTVGEHGNTSAASIPLALDHGVRSGLIRPGQRVLMEGVGGGFTWGAIISQM